MNIDIPKDLIATEPSAKRDEARLFIYDTKKDVIRFDLFKNILDYIPKNSLFVLNNTRVIKARAHLSKQTGGKIEVFFLLNEWDQSSDIPTMTDRRLKIGDKVFFDDANSCVVTSQKDNIFYLNPSFEPTHIYELLEQYGKVPLPPYIKNTKLNETQLEQRYQTVFAKDQGSVAAPTASLHFTQQLLSEIELSSNKVSYITLDVGLGTFASITPENIKEKTLHKERYRIPLQTASLINEQKLVKNKVIAVGTTVVRTLESAASKIKSTQGQQDIADNTNIFIMPPYQFQVVDILITNFHMPKTSLVMLVEAFLQQKKSSKKIEDLYRIAIDEKFRFFSFGDSMLIL